MGFCGGEVTVDEGRPRQGEGSRKVNAIGKLFALCKARARITPLKRYPTAPSSSPTSPSCSPTLLPPITRLSAQPPTPIRPFVHSPSHPLPFAHLFVRPATHSRSPICSFSQPPTPIRPFVRSPSHPLLFTHSFVRPATHLVCDPFTPLTRRALSPIRVPAPSPICVPAPSGTLLAPLGLPANPTPPPRHPAPLPPHNSHAAMFTTPGSGAVQHRPGTSHPASEGPVAAAAPHSRLWFHSFLSPCRCKYPLLLEALRSKVHRQGVDAIIAAAVESMHAVVMCANEACCRRVAAARSKLIVECIEPHPVRCSPQLSP